ncbi:MAG: deaminase [bacterium]|nr:deaminase [bacterium]
MKRLSPSGVLDDREMLRYLLRLAYQEAQKSRDPSTQNGAVLVSDTGRILVQDHNHFPMGVQETPERWDRAVKLKWIEHAERNVCYRGAWEGVGTKGLIMVCPWAACMDCARAIIQCGIKALVTHKQAHDRTPERWKADVDEALGMLKEAGVQIIYYDGEIGGIEGLRHSGEVWNP